MKKEMVFAALGTAIIEGATAAFAAEVGMPPPMIGMIVSVEGAAGVAAGTLSLGYLLRAFVADLHGKGGNHA